MAGINYNQDVALDREGIRRSSIDRFRGSRNAFVNFGGAHPDTLIFANPAEASRTRVIAIIIHTDSAGEVNFFDGAAPGGTRHFPTIEVAANTNVILDINDLGGGLICTAGLTADPTANDFEIWVSYLYEKDTPLE